MQSSAYASPQGGQVSAGQATISQQHLTTDIHQSSQNAVINWQKFDIQPTETVNFHQPNAQSITLNRVVGNEESVIRGAMNANGKVFISNPNGVLIGKEAQINVGSLVATTQNIKDDDLMNGKLKFDGQAGGKVENLANIRVPKGGVIALIAPIVKNSGKLTASEGAVLLASAEQFRITLPKDNFSYTLDRGTLQGLVDNKGAILADGGRVVLTAKGIDAVKKSVIKHSGTIEANTVSNKNGVVELLGDLEHSELHMTGSIKAEGKGSQQGGQVETSAASLKISEKAKVSTKSEKGKTGKWTIDPKDFTVAKSGGDMSGQAVSNALKNNNVELKSRNGAKEGKGDVVINDEISWDKNTLTLNAENDIHINKTLNGTGSAKLVAKFGQATPNGGNAETYLEKHKKVEERTIRVNLPEGKNLITQKGTSGEVMTFDVIHKMPTIKADGSTKQFSSKYIALGKDIDLSYTRNHKNFLGWGELAPDEYGGAFLNLTHFEGLGHQLSNLTISSNNGEDDYSSDDHNYKEVGLFRCLCSEGSLGYATISNLRLSNVNIDMPKYWFVGGLVGDGDHLNIYDSYVSGNIRGKQQVGGLVGVLRDRGNIDNSHVNANVSGTYFVGGLVGESDSGDGKVTISNSSAKGMVSGNQDGDHIGGLIGLGIDTEIQKSYSKNTVSGDYFVGGLVGSSYKNKIENSYSESRIESNHYSGGIIGQENDWKYNNHGGATTITNSYYKGNMNNFVGRLADNTVDIYNSYFIATINGETPTFIRDNENGTYNTHQSYYLGTRDENDPRTYDSRSEAQLKQQSTYEGWDFENTWVMGEDGYPKLRALSEKPEETKPDYILDIDKPDPTPPDETDNIPQTTDIKVNYDKEKGFMIIPATQHEQLKITYTDNNGSTHTVHIKQGADAFWYFPSGNSTGSTLNKNNGVLRWLNNLQEGSWITVEGMNSDSPSMVRKFEVDEFTGRKARLEEEERIRRAQQLAEQKRKDEEQKERQRQEEEANKNNGNNTTGGNISSGNNSSTTVNSGNQSSGSNTNSGGNTGSTATPSNPPATNPVNYEEEFKRAENNLNAYIKIYQTYHDTLLRDPSRLTDINNMIKAQRIFLGNQIKHLPSNDSRKRTLETKLNSIRELSVPVVEVEKPRVVVAPNIPEGEVEFEVELNAAPEKNGKGDGSILKAKDINTILEDNGISRGSPISDKFKSYKDYVLNLKKTDSLTLDELTYLTETNVSNLGFLSSKNFNKYFPASLKGEYFDKLQESISRENKEMEDANTGWPSGTDMAKIGISMVLNTVDIIATYAGQTNFGNKLDLLKKLGNDDQFKRALDSTNAIIDGNIKDMIRNAVFGTIESIAPQDALAIFEGMSKMVIALSDSELDTQLKIKLSSIILDMSSSGTKFLPILSGVLKTGAVWLDSYALGVEVNANIEKAVLEKQTLIQTKYQIERMNISREYLIKAIKYNGQYKK